MEWKFREAKERFGCALLHYSVLSNHMHFIVEAKKAEELSRFMQGLMIRMAKALNKHWSRKGSIFLDRFFARLCDKTKAGVRYVINNARRHNVPLPPDTADPFSSGRYYPQWATYKWSLYHTDPTHWPVVKGDYGDFHRNPIIWVDEAPGWVIKSQS